MGNLQEDINLILIMPNGRSGSYLVQSLFDSHDEVIMFPGHHYHYQLPPMEACKDHRQFAQDFVEDHPHFFDSTRSYFSLSEAQLGEQEVRYFDIDTSHFVDTYRKLLDAETTLTHKSAWILAHLAFAEVTGRDPTKIRHIFFHMHGWNEESIAGMFEDFPDLFYLASTRDPREEWISWCKFLKGRYGSDKLFNQLVTFSKNALSNRISLPILYDRCSKSHMKIVDLARLHTLQGEAMETLADWLQIRYQPSLTQSTVMGIPWLGNASDKTPNPGFDAKRGVSRHREAVSQVELEIIEHFCGPMLRSLGYRPPEDTLSRAAALRRVFLYPEGIVLLNTTNKRELVDYWCREPPSKTNSRINLLGRLSEVLPFEMAQRTACLYLSVTDVVHSVRFFLKRFSMREIRRMECQAEKFRQAAFDKEDIL